MAVNPAFPAVIYLRGAGVSEDTWQRVEQAMWAQGWPTIRNRTQAWHLARGGVPVVMVDFSAGLVAEETDWRHCVRVGRVRARYGADGEMELPMRHRIVVRRPYRRRGDDGKYILDEQSLQSLVEKALTQSV